MKIRATISMGVRDEVIKTLEQYCIEQNMTKSDLVRNALIAFLQGKIKVDLRKRDLPKTNLAKPKTRTISSRVTEEVYFTLQEFCNQKNTNINQCIDKTMQKFLQDKMKKDGN